TLSDEDVVSFKRVVKPLEKRYSDYYYGMDVGKEGIDTRKGTTPPKGAGGPDIFGYKWIDSDEPGGPAFNWIDVSGAGTEVTGMGDDDHQGPFPIGFTFEYYGNEYTEFYIQSNGTINFIDEYITLANQPIPTEATPNNFLAWMWDDLNPAAGGQIFYHTIGNQLIIQFVNYNEYGAAGTVDAEVIISANGAITYQYLSFKLDMDLIGCTVGIENGDGTDGLEVIFNAEYLHDELAVRFSAESAWLSEGVTEGTVEPDGSMDIWAYANSAGLLGGDHLAKIIISSNDPVTPETFIPVGLHVTGTPIIAVNPTAVDFTEPVFVGGIDSMMLYVKNDGTIALNVSDIVSDNDVYTVDQTAFEVAVYDSVGVMVYFSPTDAVAENGTLTISSDDPVNSSLVVNVSGNGILPPQISVDPTEITVNISGLDSTDVAITINNDAVAGAADLVWSASIGDPITKIVIPAKEISDGNSGFKQPLVSNVAKTMEIKTGIKSLRGIINVLIVTPDDDISDLEAALSAFPDLAVTRFPEVDLSTLSLSDLMPYDLVMTTNNTQWLSGGGVDPAQVGNVLADFIDAGGKAIVNNFTYDWDAWAMGGRFIDEQYGPFTATSSDNTGSVNLGTVHAPDHPIMEGVTAITNSYLWQNPGLAPGATRIADWDDGNLFVAANENAVALNILPSDGSGVPGWTGDLATMYNNAIVWLAGGGSFIELLEPAEGSIAPQGNMQLTARIFGLDVPDTSYYASIVVS
ncbi:MAG: hypothetical protein KAR38_05150, partial [Calditrichia bacterium]|nr:hypothetical protein [Calditrichia bacterium]